MSAIRCKISFILDEFELTTEVKANTCEDAVAELNKYFNKLGKSIEITGVKIIVDIFNIS